MHTHVKSNCTNGRACTHVLMCDFGACDTCIRRVSDAFSVELVAGLYHITYSLDIRTTFYASSTYEISYVYWILGQQLVEHVTKRDSMIDDGENKTAFFATHVKCVWFVLKGLCDNPYKCMISQPVKSLVVK